VLALVPWILEHPGVTLAELAERFEVDESELELDLELLPMCGLPPYTADRLIDVYVGDDGAVSMRLAVYFERPLRLTPAEGVALVAVGRALLAVPGSDGSGPLATALGKLEQAVGATGQIAVHVDAADHLDRLRDAAERGDQVEIDYYSSARDEMTTRVVDPIRVFHALGAWYLGAWCHRAGDERLFRIDRVRAVRATGARVEPRAASAADGDADLVYRPAPDDLRVRLRLAPEAAWVAESIPVEERIDRARGRVDVVLAVSGRAFLERLLLSLGPAAEVLGPPEAKEIRAVAARRVLARYDVTGRPQVGADDVGV
jgi:proteasome accessory factor C